MAGARFLLALLPALSLACTPPRLGPGEVSNSRLITEDEIVASRASNAFEVIHKLRANFLTSRGETSLNRNQSAPYPTVYVDDQEYDLPEGVDIVSPTFFETPPVPFPYVPVGDTRLEESLPVPDGVDLRE